MQLDTGCALSLAPLSFLKEVCSDVTLKPTNVVLSTYTGETVHPLREAFVNVEYSGTQYSLPLLFVQEGSCASFGRNWLMDVKLDWKNLPGLNHIGPLSSPASAVPTSAGNQTFDSVFEHYSEIFHSQLGCYTGKPVVLNESKEVTFHKARPVPYYLLFSGCHAIMALFCRSLKVCVFLQFVSFLLRYLVWYQCKLTTLSYDD